VEVCAVIGTSRFGEERPTLSGARHAFFEGDFEHALALCDKVRARDDATRFEIATLRARLSLRLDRADRAIDALRTVAFASLSIDQNVTARMLLGAAYVRLGQLQRGDSLLAEAAADSVQAHPTIQAEVALNLGIARYRGAAYDDAERFLSSVPSDADIIYARALEYRGWLAQARGDANAAARWFRTALDTLERCSHRDRYVEGSALYGLAMQCPKLLAVEEWPEVERRLRGFDWSASGVGIWRFWILVAASMLAETVGEADRALGFAREADNIAPNLGYRVVALCQTASLFRGLREPNAHREFVHRAQYAYEALSLPSLSADLQQLPLYLAEQPLTADAIGDAVTLLGQYRDVIVPSLRMPPGDAEWFGAVERSLTASIAEAQGDRPRAVRDFSSSHRVAAHYGDRRRAAEIALRLVRLTGSERYIGYASDVLKAAAPSFWMVRELNELRRGEGPKLTATEAAVLRLLVAGKSYKEVAAERHMSVKTVDHRVQSLFRKFGVHSRSELAAEALRRRIVTLNRPRHSR
jgi:DNA-binding CsgD family transcriptional regulator